MPIPPFDDRGLLPTGNAFDIYEGDAVYCGHDATLDEIQAHFVAPYVNSAARAVLFQELRNLTDSAYSFLPCFALYVSGEFVTDVDLPDTLYVVLDVSAEYVGQLSPVDQFQLRRLFDDQKWSPADDLDVTVDTGLVIAYPPGHSRFDLGNKRRLLCRWMAGSPNADDVIAGHVEIFHCPQGVADVEV